MPKDGQIQKNFRQINWTAKIRNVDGIEKAIQRLENQTQLNEEKR